MKAKTLADLAVVGAALALGLVARHSIQSITTDQEWSLAGSRVNIPHVYDASYWTNHIAIGKPTPKGGV